MWHDYLNATISQLKHVPIWITSAKILESFTPFININPSCATWVVRMSYPLGNFANMPCICKANEKSRIIAVSANVFSCCLYPTMNKVYLILSYLPFSQTHPYSHPEVHIFKDADCITEHHWRLMQFALLPFWHMSRILPHTMTPYHMTILPSRAT